MHVASDRTACIGLCGVRRFALLHYSQHHVRLIIVRSQTVINFNWFACSDHILVYLVDSRRFLLDCMNTCLFFFMRYIMQYEPVPVHGHPCHRGKTTQI